MPQCLLISPPDGKLEKSDADKSVQGDCKGKKSYSGAVSKCQRGKWAGPDVIRRLTVYTHLMLYLYMVMEHGRQPQPNM